MFNLTPQEKTVLLFLAAVFLSGVSLNYFSKPNRRSQAYFNSLTQQINKSLDLNKASLEELKSLPGIGDEFARRIVDYRLKVGTFKSIEDIKNIKGIGNRKFELLKDKITVE